MLEGASFFFSRALNGARTEALRSAETIGELMGIIGSAAFYMVLGLGVKMSQLK